jgi:hypothetical protein
VFFELSEIIYPELLSTIAEGRLVDKNLESLIQRTSKPLAMTSDELTALSSFVFSGQKIKIDLVSHLCDNSIFTIEGLMKFGNKIRIDNRITLWQKVENIGMHKLSVQSLFSNRFYTNYKTIVLSFEEMIRMKQSQYYFLLCNALNCNGCTIIEDESLNNVLTRCTLDEISMQSDVRIIRKTCITIRQNLNLSSKDELVVHIPDLDTKLSSLLEKELLPLRTRLVKDLEHSGQNSSEVLIGGVSNRIVFST